MNNKAAVTQVFVYLLSIIMILFIGFLVTKFIFTFTDDAQSVQEVKFFDELEEIYSSVYREWGSEKVHTFRVTQNVEYACFMRADCTGSGTPVSEDELNALQSAGDNVVLFSDSGVIGSRAVGSFNLASGASCECFKTSDSRIELVVENDRNVILISEN